MPTTMPSVLPHPMQLSNLATAVRMRSQEGSSPLSSPIQKPAPNRKPRKKRVDLHGKLEAMSDEPLADLLRAQTQPWTPEEDHLIVQMVEQVGHKWSAIATLLPGRTDNGVRNRWNRLDRCCPAFDSPLSTRLTPHALTNALTPPQAPDAHHPGHVRRLTSPRRARLVTGHNARSRRTPPMGRIRFRTAAAAAACPSEATRALRSRRSHRCFRRCCLTSPRRCMAASSSSSNCSTRCEAQLQ